MPPTAPPVAGIIPVLPPWYHPRHWPWWGAVGLLWLGVRLPFHCWQALGSGLGELLYLTATSRRRVAATNLALCFPHWCPRERRRRCRDHFRALGRGLLETAWCWFAPRATLARRLVAIDGIHHLQRALDQGHGALLLSAHFTHMEVGATLLGLHYPGAAVFRPYTNPGLDALMQRRRARFAHRRRTVTNRRPREMLRCLADNAFLWLAPDQNYRGPKPHFASLLGIPVALYPGLSTLARHSRAPVLPFYQQRVPGGFRLIIGPPLAPFPSADPNADARLVAHQLEAMIRCQPTAYLWIHRLFKTPPPRDTPPHPPPPPPPPTRPPPPPPPGPPPAPPPNPRPVCVT
ncbi:MAG: lipid A biosynthesis lauroyl acyltransferase [Candidatus Competibacterales bacterium]